MLTIILFTLGMIAATFLVGLSVAWLMRLTANVLYYFEHRSLTHDIKARMRLMRMKSRRAIKADSDNTYHSDLIDYSRGEDSQINKSQPVINQLFNFYRGVNKQLFHKNDDESLMSYYHGNN